MKITLLGTGHGLSDDGRYLTSTMLEVGKKRYVFDAGAPIDTLFSVNGWDMSDLSAIFITHMHDDHLWGINSVPYGMPRRSDSTLTMIFPSEVGKNAYIKWRNTCHAEPEKNLFYEYVEDFKVCYDDGTIRVTPKPTKHIAVLEHEGNDRSHGYEIEACGKKILITGDLALDFSDYAELIKDGGFDAVICELTHFDVDENIELLKSTDTKKLIFTHVRGDRVKQLQKYVKDFEFEVAIGNDMDTFEI